MSKKIAAQSWIAKGHHVVLWYPGKTSPMWKNHLERAAIPSDVTNVVTDFDVALVPKVHAVIDLDVKSGKDGLTAFDSLCHQSGTSLDALTKSTLVTKTPSGGRHLWFSYTGDLTSCNCGDGIEFKRLTGTVHVPPSTGYSWLVRKNPIPLPNWLVDFWKNHRSSTVRLAREAVYDKGSRHDCLKVFAAVARKHLYLNPDEMNTLLHETNQQRCVPPLPTLEVDLISEWAAGLDADGLEVGAMVGDELQRFLAKAIYA